MDVYLYEVKSHSCVLINQGILVIHPPTTHTSSILRPALSLSILILLLASSASLFHASHACFACFHDSCQEARWALVCLSSSLRAVNSVFSLGDPIAACVWEKKENNIFGMRTRNGAKIVLCNSHALLPWGKVWWENQGLCSERCV